MADTVGTFINNAVDAGIQLAVITDIIIVTLVAIDANPAGFAGICFALAVTVFSIKAFPMLTSAYFTEFTIIIMLAIFTVVAGLAFITGIFLGAAVASPVWLTGTFAGPGYALVARAVYTAGTFFAIGPEMIVLAFVAFFTGKAILTLATVITGPAFIAFACAIAGYTLAASAMLAVTVSTVRSPMFGETLIAQVTGKAGGTGVIQVGHAFSVITVFFGPAVLLFLTEGAAFAVLTIKAFHTLIDFVAVLALLAGVFGVSGCFATG